jgi:hypothetical protein
MAPVGIVVSVSVSVSVVVGDGRWERAAIERAQEGR